MRVAVAGGTGFIGQHLIRVLKEQGDEVVLVSRSAKGHNPYGLPVVTWDNMLEQRDKLEGLDAFVNLSGESISQRWTAAAKHRILQSRLDTAVWLGQLVDALKVKPKVVVNGSGMSYYGASETDTYDERCPKRITDFLAEVVDKWEQAVDDHVKGTRIVKLRVGLVLGTDGGALPPMAMPYKLGAGGRVGNGKGWMSWIHIDDIVRLIRFCIEHSEIAGPVNATAPTPVRNDAFGRALGHALHRPHWMPIPAFMLRLILGEMSVLLLGGQKVLPKVALDHGFTFRYNTVEEALNQLYARG